MSSKKLSNLTEKVFNSRFSAFFSILSLYILLSFLIRVVFLIWSSKDVDFNFIYILRIFFTGLLYDFVSGSLFLFLYLFYLLIFPKKWIGSLFDKAFTYFYFAVILLVLYFSLLAEIPFWEEFGARFNFIAVDYLILYLRSCRKHQSVLSVAVAYRCFNWLGCFDVFYDEKI